jgi:hypothetical protein
VGHAAVWASISLWPKRRHTPLLRLTQTLGLSASVLLECSLVWRLKPFTFPRLLMLVVKVRKSAWGLGASPSRLLHRFAQVLGKLVRRVKKGQLVGGASRRRAAPRSQLVVAARTHCFSPMLVRAAHFCVALAVRPQNHQGAPSSKRLILAQCQFSNQWLGLTIRSTGSSGACRCPGLHFIMARPASYPTAPVNSHVRPHNRLAWLSTDQAVKFER